MKNPVAIIMAAFCASAFSRTVETLSDGWEFSRGNAAWAAVAVPHDWAISGPFDREIDKQTVAIEQNGEKDATEKTGRSGALPWVGEGTYRRTVEIPEGVGYASLVFEGAMSEPEVFWDGAKAGEWKYGYNVFEVEVPAKPGKHSLEVRLRNLPESTRWYPGGGLFRPVRLVAGPRCGIATFGVYVRTPTLQTWQADVEVRNPDNIATEVRNRVKEGDGPYNPWSPEEPNLYTLVTDLVDAKSGEVIDTVETRFGFRTLEYGSFGFKLNGEVRKFKGVCLHHDLGPLGAAFDKAAFRRQVRKLKEIGCDSIRTAHNMPAPEQIEICDEMGMMVMAESFDGWKQPKCKNGYNRFYDEWWRRDLENLVKVNRSHPSVVMWSIGNEVPEQWWPMGFEHTKAMVEFVHSLDRTRPVTQGMDQWPGPIKSGIAGVMDVNGLNYRLHRYAEAREASRLGAVLGSETASSFSSRGCYHFPVKVMATNDNPHRDGQCSSYDVEYASWANLPDDDRAMQEDSGWVMGEFVWTGFDYLGEPSPYDTYWPSRSSYFGIYDLAGIAKDRAWLYRSYWRKDAPTLHIVPSRWTFPGREGETTPVYVYTDADSAELFVNGKSQGVRVKDKSSRLDRFRLRWNDVVYEPGEIKVTCPDGRSASLRTAGAPAAIKIEAEPFDARDTLRFFEVSIVDKDGNLAPDASHALKFGVTGDAAFKAACNGDPTSLESFISPGMKAFHGKLVVVVQGVHGTLKISADGLEDGIAQF